MQWNALDATAIANSKTAHRRFQEWERAGVFHEIWRQGLLDYDQQVGIDWSFLAADGAMTKAPLGGAATGGWSGRREAPGVARRCRLTLVSSRPPSNRVGARLALAPPTPPGVRVRTGRFAQRSRKRR
jgi:hypothetical protein